MKDARRRFTQRQARQMAIACGGKCGRCNADLQDGFHMHHINPHAKGGATSLANCLALCPKCHKEIHREKS